MTNHYVATVPVKFTDTDGQERTRFQRVGAMFRNTRNGDGSEFFSLKGAIHKNLSALASRFLRQSFGDPNLSLLDPACPPCRRGLRPPAVPSEHMRVRPDPRAVLGKGTHWTGGSPGGEGGRAASLWAAGEADTKAA